MYVTIGELDIGILYLIATYLRTSRNSSPLRAHMTQTPNETSLIPDRHQSNLSSEYHQSNLNLQHRPRNSNLPKSFTPFFPGFFASLVLQTSPVFPVQTPNDTKDHERDACRFPFGSTNLFPCSPINLRKP